MPRRCRVGAFSFKEHSYAGQKHRDRADKYTNAPVTVNSIKKHIFLKKDIVTYAIAFYLREPGDILATIHRIFIRWLFADGGFFLVAACGIRSFPRRDKNWAALIA
ncbi:MAG TPA: hypothetical protein VKU82_08880 [Planctomycetaceae bacterium]|nr:hypothetical protein [Planctomycetaceae bacterium]